MELKINIEMDNAAFDLECYVEVARILRDYASRIEQYGELERILYDVKGNKVGKAEIYR